jgi:hypothetical protein
MRSKSPGRVSLAIALTVCTLAVVNGVVHFGAGIVVLGAAIALTAGRSGSGRSGSGRSGSALVNAVAFLVGAGSVSAVVLVFAGSAWIVEVLFVLVVFVGTAARGFGGRVAAVGQAVMFAFLALFIAPVAPGADRFGWALLAAAVAYGSTLLASVGEPREVPDEDDQPNLRAHVWRGVRAALPIGLAFGLGGLLFPGHQVWAVTAAFVIGVGTASRGEAVFRGAQRTFGAILGTIGATLLASVLDGRAPLSVGLILVFLGVGLYLRQVSYMFWAVAVTSVLALLYGLNGQTDAALLRERILAGLLGGACAIVPALLLAPIRTRALVLKRAGAALRSIGAALRGEPGQTAALVRRAESDIAALRYAAGPLLAIRRFHRRAEVAWVDGLTAALPDLRALAAGQTQTRQRLAHTTREIAAGVKAAAERRGAST